MPWAQIIVGLLALTMGRQLFWVFVAAVGFIYGMEAAPALFPAQPPGVLLLIAIIAGLIGAVLAYFLQWAAVAFAGFLVGGRLAVLIVASLGPPAAGYLSIPFLIGGIIGAVIVLLFFDWALIILSSIVGAMLITGAVTVGPSMTLFLLGALTALGIIIQAAWFEHRAPVRYSHSV